MHFVTLAQNKVGRGYAASRIFKKILDEERLCDHLDNISVLPNID